MITRSTLWSYFNGGREEAVFRGLQQAEELEPLKRRLENLQDGRLIGIGGGVFSVLSGFGFGVEIATVDHGAVDFSKLQDVVASYGLEASGLGISTVAAVGLFRFGYLEWKNTQAARRRISQVQVN